MKKKSILVICAHADDNVFGPGGTLIKYAREGHKVYTIIFSFGAGSHPHLKRELIEKTRAQEARKVNEFMGGKEVVFLGLKEGKLLHEFSSIMQKRLGDYIKRFKPSMIFTHSADEYLKDHRDVNRAVLKTCKKINYRGNIYTFDVWNIINFKPGIRAKLVVDVSETFKDKIKALNMYKSQKLSLFSLLWSVYVLAFFNGLRHNMKFAEVFYKARWKK
jgi:LmbE family N-acetylglucosaminyl deacetylase